MGLTFFVKNAVWPSDDIRLPASLPPPRALCRSLPLVLSRPESDYSGAGGNSGKGVGGAA
jgi:hypothetical protein